MMAYLILLCVLAAVDIAHSQSGFLSIDCGIPSGTNYTDKTTGINYISDAPYIATGRTYDISNQYKSNSPSKQYLSLRSFPDGNRNCYTLKAVIKHKYLIRALFLYGNYDGQHNPPQFDLYIGVNLWITVNLTDSTTVFESELITIATADHLSICLVKTGQFDNPFISAIEVRALKSTMYTVLNKNVSLRKLDGINCGSFDTIIRSPIDTYDRKWRNWTVAGWPNLNTSLGLKMPNGDEFAVPSAVMSTAVQPPGMLDLRIPLNLTSNKPNQRFYVCLHFAEVVKLSGNQSRIFSVFLDAAYQAGPFTPLYLLTNHAIFQFPATQRSSLSLHATPKSTQPPLLNALELYYIVNVSKPETNAEDVNGIMEIRTLYHVMRDWQGDPCAPINFTWEGLRCNFSGPNPRIVYLNLSSSKLTGNIPEAIAKLKALEYLDLSNNSLTGQIPDFLASLPSLRLLNLTGNNFTGTVPQALLLRSANGSLTLSDDFVTNDHKKTSASDIIAIAAMPTVLVSVLAFVVCMSRRRRPKAAVDSARSLPQRAPIKKQPSAPVKSYSTRLELKKQKFTYSELEEITSNFEKAIGKGGFGTVFCGDMGDGTKVAVKLRSRLSSLGSKEFQAEAQLLVSVHHKNLVSLIGYCVDNIHLALVYEYMAKGSLREHLIGKTSDTKALNWIQRLQIVVDAAQGLEYLHTRCKPPIIHGDMKTSNILLNHELEAKIADFGISKTFLQDSRTHQSTTFVGTPGYLDPEYRNTYKLNEKSDIYSFGVVLLELITGHCAILSGPHEVHIVKWVQKRVEKGEIADIADAKLEGDYDFKTLWKVTELALNCTISDSEPRPGISEVVVLLRECLTLELVREKAQNLYSELL